jgi:purine-binding chemotaxis protein CheW
MDIAKIRKKIREMETGGQQKKAEGGAVKKPKELQDEKTPETSPHGQIPAAESQADGKDQTIETDIDIDIGQEPTPSFQKEFPDKEEDVKIPAAEKGSESEIKEEVVEILTFRLLQEEFAFRISQLAEILRHQRITRVPKVPNYILGITSLRGKVIPVIDLKLKLSLAGEQSVYEQKGKILIINGPKGPIGAAVDKVIGVSRMAKSDILPPPSHLSERELKFIYGVAVVDKRFVSIINMEETVSLHLK